MTRIGINLLWLVPGVVGGSEEYTVGLLAGIADRAERTGDVPQITVFARPELPAAHPDVLGRFRVETAALAPASKVRRVLAESTWLARAVAAANVEVVHHAGGTLPWRRSAPAILTVHDLQPLVFPDHFHPVKRRYLARRLPASVDAARLVLTPSEWVRGEVIDRLGADPDRVIAIPLGYAPDGVPATEPPAARHPGSSPFILYPAIPYPHKNHGVLVRAAARLRDLDLRLVLTGGEGPSDGSLARAARAAGVEDRILRTGRVPAAELAWYYEHAVAMTFPSRFEGFGLPILEAMGHGCPVLAADASALPEAAGGAAVLLDAEDDAAWAEAIRAVVTDPAHRRSLARAGRERVRRIDRTASVDRLVGAYEQAATG